MGGKLPVIISPLAYVSKHAGIEEGTIVMHYALENAKWLEDRVVNIPSSVIGAGDMIQRMM